MRLGTFPATPPDTARGAALGALGALATGAACNDGPKRRVAPFVREAVAAYLGQIRTERRRKMMQSSLYPFLPLFDRRITDVRREDLLEVHRKMADKPTAANQSVKALCAAIRLAQRRRGMPIASLTLEFPWYERQPRERYVTRDEAPRFFAALEARRGDKHDGMLVDIIYMMLYTGARKCNVCEMMAEEVSANGVWTIPAEKSKSGRAIRIQLGRVEKEILTRCADGRKTGQVFPHSHPLYHRLKRVLDAVCGDAGMKDFHVHDIRRTLGTWMLSSGVPIAVVSKKLGHASIGITEQVYAHLMPEVGVNASEEAVEAMRHIKK